MDKHSGNKSKDNKSAAQSKPQSQSQKSSAEFAKEICPKEKNNNCKK